LKGAGLASDEKKLRAQALLRLAASSEGKLFLEELGQDFDQEVRTLLFAKPDSIFVAQGRAQAYNAVLKKFSDAKQELDKR
jgi:hypothetical protein